MSRVEETHTEHLCDIKRETTAAVQIITQHGELIWIPLSQVKDMTRDPMKGCSSVTMTRWIAGQKGLL